MDIIIGILLMSILMQWQGTQAKGIEPLRKRVTGETHMAEPTWFCINRLKAAKTWRTVKSPGYPAALDMKHSRCTWKIVAPGKMSVRLAFRGIGLAADDPEHCSSNYLEIIDEILGKSQTRLCGRITAGDIVSQGNKLRMDLQRDPSEKFQRGFSISYMATKVKPGFYAKKSFNEKPLPPMKRSKPKEKETEKDAVKKPQDAAKSKGVSPSNSQGVIFIGADGQLIQGNPTKRQVNNNRFKAISETEGSTGGVSTLVIVAIVIGGCIGLLIFIMVLRKLLMKDKNKNKDRDGEAVQTNSGMPKINMTHDNVSHAKRNILSPNIVVNRRGSNPPPIVNDPTPREYHEWSSSDSQNSDPAPDNRKISAVKIPAIGREISRRNPSFRQGSQHVNGQISTVEIPAIGRKISRKKPSFRQESRHVNGLSNRAYEDEVPQPRVRSDDSPPSQSRNRKISKRQTSPDLPSARKIPYRYNSHKNQGWDQKKALEALNNEKFCEYESVYLKTQPQHQRQTAKHRGIIPTRESTMFQNQDRDKPKVRQYLVKRSLGDDSTIDSDDSDVFPPESPNRKGNFPKRFFNGTGRERELPGTTSPTTERKNRLAGDRSRTWYAGGKSISKPEVSKPVKRRSTVGEVRDIKARRDLKSVEQKGRSDKKNGYLSKKDYKIEGLNGKTRSRFEPDPPSPSLPRHVVPSSRR